MWQELQEICAINAPSGKSNKTAVLVILSMQSLVLHQTSEPGRPCDSISYTVPKFVWKFSQLVFSNPMIPLMALALYPYDPYPLAFSPFSYSLLQYLSQHGLYLRLSSLSLYHWFALLLMRNSANGLMRMILTHLHNIRNYITPSFPWTGYRQNQMQLQLKLEHEILCFPLFFFLDCV